METPRSGVGRLTDTKVLLKYNFTKLRDAIASLEALTSDCCLEEIWSVSVAHDGPGYKRADHAGTARVRIGERRDLRETKHRLKCRDEVLAAGGVAGRAREEDTGRRRLQIRVAEGRKKAAAVWYTQVRRQIEKTGAGGLF